ncbi:CoA-binding protein [Desulfolutivibrio sulfoxidireducens]|uniref:CoA-binding protein n=1 Tax=Desulfolutivibrio sulfoxidireducens TaxID=2773299 RepID=UPI00159E5226|nr:CoA-binding protein [Desulfolutivibrio sulfoxidireducens]QLA16463.1 CoA-binding protein [Desulfolutivibrio sulfoxidireducens]
MLDDDRALRELLRTCRTVAVVGAKDRPGAPVDGVGRYLLDVGFTVYPVHPARKTVWGLTAYPSLADVPGPIDIVVLFRAPQHCPDHAREAVALVPPPRIFWMQSGISSPEAASILAGMPVHVVSDRCLMVEHRRLLA